MFEGWEPLIAGVFALVGAGLGAFLGRVNEHKKWLREERMKAYQEYLSLFGVAQIRNFLQILGHADSAEAEVLPFFEKIHNASVRMMVLAPSKIADEVSETLDLMFELQGWANELPGELAQKHYSDRALPAFGSREPRTLRARPCGNPEQSSQDVRNRGSPCRCTEGS